MVVATEAEISHYNVPWIWSSERIPSRERNVRESLTAINRRRNYVHRRSLDICTRIRQQIRFTVSRRATFCFRLRLSRIIATVHYRQSLHIVLGNISVISDRLFPPPWINVCHDDIGNNSLRINISQRELLFVCIRGADVLHPLIEVLNSVSETAFLSEFCNLPQDLEIPLED